MFKLFFAQHIKADLFVCIYERTILTLDSEYCVLVYNGKRPPKIISKQKFKDKYARCSYSGKFQGERDLEYIKALHTGMAIGINL